MGKFSDGMDVIVRKIKVIEAKLFEKMIVLRGDPGQALELKFKSQEEAIRFVESQGLSIFIIIISLSSVFH